MHVYKDYYNLELHLIEAKGKNNYTIFYEK